MKNIIIGTAGHIDHGKTTLIKALTGRNTDRWEEEQRRGITIDLGFTYFDLKSGDRAGIIDVPGHERFINNMVAGVVGMDLVMLVIAADEGIMPQTREHMDILGLLGIKKSILVLNKCDLVDEEWLELVEEEIKEELKGTFLEQAPIVHVSAATGEGIDHLKEVIEMVAREEVEEKEIHTIPRLPVDRVFSLSGFGTIVTGTLISGKITKDTTLCMYPIQRECKIRSIQVHGKEVDECFAGQRVAINLSNIKKSELQRGYVLAPPESMKNTMMLDVKMKVLESSVRILKNHTRLHLFTGTSEVLCRAVLLDKEEIGPGEEGYVQLRLEEEIALRRGDKFVVRFYSPMETVGGGVVLEPNPSKKKRFHQETIEELKRKEGGSSADVIELHVRQYQETMVTAQELAKLTALSLDEVLGDIQELEEERILVSFPMKKETYVWHRVDFDGAKEAICPALKAYQEQYPYRYGMKKAEVHMKFYKKMKLNVFDRMLECLVEEGALEKRNEYLHLPGFHVEKDARFQKVANIFARDLAKAGYDFLRYSEMEFSNISKEVVDDILAILVDERAIVKINEEMYTLPELIDAAKEKIQEKLKQDGMITIAEVRDMFQTSRKSAKPILEYMDSIKVTKRTGAESERAAFV